MASASSGSGALGSSSLDFHGAQVDGSMEDVADMITPLCFSMRRHHQIKQLVEELLPWRLKERMKTVSVALVLCLNVGVDPPDCPRSSPCARMECWLDPFATTPNRALEAIGANLQRQYERWQPRARYKLTLDPTVDEVKRVCTNMRRSAKDERVLYHYNGHGVPRPTRNGEIWVFNKAYTQYIPLSLYDLQTWIGSPAIYVWECNAAGIVLEEFQRFITIREEDKMKCNAMGMSMSAPAQVHNAIQLAACGPDETLPLDPNMPADLFTSCLTTPIKTSLRWWYFRRGNRKMVPGITADMLDKIPGRLTDRRTALGELNWIFTSIADTIAWDILPTDTFQDLFRHDLLVASLFRNFLLAELVMDSYDCKPVSCPVMPAAKYHPMWDLWEMIMEGCLMQLPNMIKNDAQYEHSNFFSEQLKAFAVWLSIKNTNRAPPQQLPVILQVLLSPVHRCQALELLGYYLDLGPAAVHTALNVGIFPYVVKLLQSTAFELRPLLVFVWAKILAVDPTCRADLIKDGGFKYFLHILSEPNLPGHHARHHEYQAMSAFILTCIVKNHPAGQEICLQCNLIAVCLDLLDTHYAQLRQWVILCLGCMWDKFDKARWCGVRDSAHEKLFPLLADPSPEIRAAVVFALGTFLSNPDAQQNEQSSNIDQMVGNRLTSLVLDGSNLVREELCLVFRTLVSTFETQFVAVMLEDAHRQAQLSLLAQPPPQQHASTPVSASPSSLAAAKDSRKIGRSSSAGATANTSIAGPHLRPEQIRTSSESSSSVDSTTRTSQRTSEWVILSKSAEEELAAADSDAPEKFQLSSLQRLSDVGGANAPHLSPRPHSMQQSSLGVTPAAAAAYGSSSGGSASSPHSHFSPRSSAASATALPGSAADTARLSPNFASPPPGSSILNSSNLSGSGQSSNYPNPGYTSSSLSGSTPTLASSAAVGSPLVHSKTGTSPFSNMWKALNLLATDPHLQVEMMADRIIKRLKLTANQTRSNSMSLPSSPRPHRPRTQRVASGSGPNIDFLKGQAAESPVKRGALPRLMSMPGGMPMEQALAMEGGRSSPQIDERASTLPRAFSTQNVGGLQARMVEDYYGDLPSDIVETVSQFDTKFVDWMSSSFILQSEEWEKKSDADGKQFLERHWRFKRNTEQRAESRATLKDATSTKYRLEDQVFVNRNPEAPQCLLFHPYQNELLVADKTNITVWDWEMGVQLNTIHNHPANSKARITTLDLVNPHDVSLLMAGTDDGCVRVWRDYNIEGRGSQVAAWRALTDLAPVPRAATGLATQQPVPSLVLDWEQESGVLFASGNARIIRVWDTQREQIIQDIPTGADTCVTSLTSDVAGRSLLIAGCGDGTIRLYDRRLPPTDCLVRLLREHTAYVVKVHLQQGASQGKIISSSVAGDVRYWDPRFEKSTEQVKTGIRISCMDVHRTAPLLAVGSRDQVAKTYHIDSQESLGTIKWHDGFMGQRIAAVSALSFHPYKLCMAAGFTDSLISIYTDDKKKL
ncbi:regulatory-associated protein of mTOR-like isoform X1 [Sycon ciliatum]|uniref:regulatory-associated protein of mTOR-like isoform X1 n=1 Tax=Sycon ciliatum TaxID=27933 RepID=UPI0031F66230